MLQESTVPDIEFPEPLTCLFQPKRHKVLYGGRGAGRSWNVARWLLLECLKSEQRVLCAREFQRSIAESVYRTLVDQINLMGLQGFFDIQANRIGAPFGGYFVFEGIKNNVTKIKSYEGITRCWVEEANKVSANSWETLLPTIRRKDAEIIVTFNPELETDYTFQRFVRKPSGKVLQTREGFTETEDSFIIKMTYKDNPWFYETAMPQEMEDLKARDYDAYLNVWEGHCRQALEGAVFAKELRRAQEETRICRVPWDPETPVDTFWDLGRRDMTCIWFAQRVAMQWRVLGYFEDSQEDIHYYLRHCQGRRYTYGTFHLPHDAKAKHLVHKRTIEQIVRAAGYRTIIIPRTPKKANAINAARILFPTCWFDENECREGLERLRHYCYAVSEETDAGGRAIKRRSEEPLHDDNSNGADAFMTMAQAIKPGKTRRPEDVMEALRRPVNGFIAEAPSLGWME